MMKELKDLSTLLVSMLAATMLVACGSAKDGSGDAAIVTDFTAPQIKSISPDILSSGSLLVPVSTNSVTFTFDEPLALDSIPTSNTLGFTAINSGKTLTGTWNYTHPNLSLTFDFSSLGAGATTLLSDEIYELKFHNTITDLQGNGLDFTVTFETEQSYDVLIAAAGLADKTVSIKVTGAGKTIPHSITGNSQPQLSSLVDTSFLANTAYTLSVDTQPDANTFCAFSNANGKVLKKNATAELNCSNVVPYYTSTSLSSFENWNSYIQPGAVDIDKPNPNEPFIHAGERRKFTMASYHPCADLAVPVDTLDAFNWSCEDDGIETVIYSTGLKSGRYLSDLLDFSSHSWRENSVTVSLTGGTEVETTTPAIWWNNPVVIPSGNNLSSYETIYMLTSTNVVDTVLNQSYTLSGKHTALVIDPKTIDILKVPATSSAAISVTSTGTWIEGEVNANGVSTGLLVTNGFYTQVRNFQVYYATADGIQLVTSGATHIVDSASTENGGNGLKVLSASGITTLGNIIHNVTLSNNDENGLIAETTAINNKFSLITANDNGASGISLSSNNHLSNSQISNTAVGTGHGLNISGQNNIVTMLTTDSTEADGIFFSASTPDSANNLLSSILTSSISFGTTQSVFDTNALINLVDTSTGATANVDNNATPTVFDTHTLVGGAVITYLNNTVEPFNDASGNDNGMCEAGEKCLFTPNTGHAQGTGDLILVNDTIDSWTTDINITLEEYTTH